jgi:thioredoxin-related protein
MKIIKLLIAVLIGITILSSCNLINSKNENISLKTEIDTSSIKFQSETLNSALKISKEKRRPVFIYFTADGCGPCLKMDHSVFTDSLVMDYFNSNFVCVKSHRKRLSNSPVVTDEEKRINKPIDIIMDKYYVSGTPSFVIIDSEGNLIHKSIGYKTQSELIQFGKDALSNDHNYSTIKTKIENGDFSFETVKLYLEGTPTSSSSFSNMFGITNQKVIANYFKTQKQSDWNSTNNWVIINNYINDFDSEQFQYLINNQNQFNQNLDKIEVDNKIYKILSNYEFNGGNIKELNSPLADLIEKRKSLMAKNYNNLNIYAKDFNDIYTEYYYLFDYEINNKSWEIYETSSQENTKIDRQTLEMAINWMRLVTSYRTDDNNYKDTFSKLSSQLVANK